LNHGIWVSSESGPEVILHPARIAYQRVNFRKGVRGQKKISINPTILQEFWFARWSLTGPIKIKTYATLMRYASWRGHAQPAITIETWWRALRGSRRGRRRGRRQSRRLAVPPLPKPEVAPEASQSARARREAKPERRPRLQPWTDPRAGRFCVGRVGSGRSNMGVSAEQLAASIQSSAFSKATELRAVIGSARRMVSIALGT